MLWLGRYTLVSEVSYSGSKQILNSTFRESREDHNHSLRLRLAGHLREFPCSVVSVLQFLRRSGIPSVFREGRKHFSDSWFSSENQYVLPF